MFLHLSVCLGGGSASVHAGIPPPGAGTPQQHPPNSTPQEQAPPEQAPPGAGTPQEQAPPGAGTPQQTAAVADGTHPTGMHSCFKMNACWPPFLVGEDADTGGRQGVLLGSSIVLWTKWMFNTQFTYVSCLPGIHVIKIIMGDVIVHRQYIQECPRIYFECSLTQKKPNYFSVYLCLVCLFGVLGFLCLIRDKGQKRSYNYI